MNMHRKYPTARAADLSLDPEHRLCPEFDSVSIKKFADDDAGEFLTRVLDNCAEDHIM